MRLQKNAFFQTFAPLLRATFLVFALLPRPAHAQQTAPVPAVDTTDRAAVVNHYRVYYLASVGLDPGWTGNLATGDAGTLGDAFRQGAVRRINYFRAMSGLNGDVTLDAAANAKCQQAALMMAAQQNISHAPPATWKFYTAEAAEACANSDIRLDWQGDEGALAVDRFVADDESNNSGAGHRRWLLYPAQTTMAVGAIPGDGWTFPGTNATWVTSVGARPAAVPTTASWPPAGYVPAALVYRRWSYSRLNADFSNATVSVTKNGVGLGVTQEALEYQTTAAGGGTMEGDNTLVWSLPGNAVSATDDEVYQVTLHNVGLDGANQTIGYTVTSINPDAATVGVTASKPTAYQGGKKGVFKVMRAGDVSAALEVAYTVGGTASPGSAYTPLAGTVTIPAGGAAAKIKVAAVANHPNSVGKTVVVTLSASGVVLDANQTQATVTIAAQP